MDRLKLILLISEEKLSCFSSARKLNIPYTNAKVIYKIFREEGRIVAKDKNNKTSNSQKNTIKGQNMINRNGVH